MTKGKDNWKLMTEQVVNEQPVIEESPPAPQQKAMGDKFFRCLQILTPITDKFHKFENKIAPNEDGSKFLNADELSYICGIIERIVKHYSHNKTVSYHWTESYIHRIRVMLENYISSLDDKKNVSEFLDNMFIELYQAVNQIRKELRHA